MQFLPVLLAIVGSTAWLAVDAAKRDWTDNGFARNVPSWVVGSLLLWPVVFPMYVFVHRKKAPLLAPAKPAAAAAMAGPRPAEAHGPSLDDVEPVIEMDHDPVVEVVTEEPVVDLAPEPVIEMDHEPVVEILREPVAPVIALETAPEPAPDVAPAPAFAPHAFEPEPDPFIEEQAAPAVVEAFVAPVAEPEYLAPQPDTEPPPPEPEPEPVAPEPEPEPVAPEPEPELVAPEPEPEPPEPEAEPVLEISHPDLPVEEAPPGLSVDAFKDIKPVAFGGAIMDDPPAPAADPLPPEPAPPAPEPPAAPPEPEPVASEPAPLPDVGPLAYPVSDEPVIEIEPEPVAFEPEPPAFDPEPAAFEPEPVAIETIPFEPVQPEPEPIDEPLAAATATDPAPVEAPAKKRRGFRLPNPELRLPGRGGRAKDKPKASRSSALKGIKLPSVTLPQNLQGPLSDVERKIVLGSVVAVVAAAAFGYTTAPSEDAAAPAPQAAPAATAR